MNILITGGAGFMGANLVRRCLAEGNVSVTVMDSLDPRFLSTMDALRDVESSIRFIEGDLRDDALLVEAVMGQDAIINCAAQTSHTLSMQDPVLDAQINCIATLKLLEAVRRHNPEATVVYTSTSSVIGQHAGGVIDEDTPERPTDIYSANNLGAEKYHQIYHEAHDLTTVCLRFANLYGPFGKRDPQFGFVNYFIGCAAAGEEIVIFGDGAQIRNVMYVEDACDILLQAARDPRLAGTIYFATGDEHCSILQVAERIVSVFERGQVRHVNWPDQRRRIEIGNVRISSERLRSLTGWRPRYDLAAGLQRTREIIKAATPGGAR